MNESVGHPRIRMIGGGIALFIAVTTALWFLILGPRQQQIVDLKAYVHELEMKQTNTSLRTND